MLFAPAFEDISIDGMPVCLKQRIVELSPDLKEVKLLLENFFVEY